MPRPPGLGYISTSSRPGWARGWRSEPPEEAPAVVNDPAPAREPAGKPPARRQPKRKRKGAAAKKTTEKEPSPTADQGPEKAGGNPGGPQLVPQPHGGAIWRGGWPKPGPGRPPSALRIELHDLANGDGMRALRAILADGSARPSDRLNALALCLRYGLGQADELTGTVADTGAALAHLRRALAGELRRVGTESFVAELERLLDEEVATEGPQESESTE